ncbi:hypothetical protein ADT25_12345 [Xanthomonas oryzae]|uniref:Transposase n=1 Tax=Xanthomonas oryzae TaxID=347 RepID=A0AAP1EZF2_9XANT|nr:hypothetical protein ADT25_12345 [Xanthomonas oryzae]QBG83204.1 hypothetical protein EYR27_03680 [Xanthomonas oryzae]
MQLTFGDAEGLGKRKQTRREIFLAEMERIVPWKQLLALFPNKLARRAQEETRGSHGFDPGLPSMRAVFLAQGPDLAQGKTLPGFDNVDVYALMTRLLGIPAAPNDGNPATLLPALRVPLAAGPQ